jgi:SAM-dependent methyltransferase
MLSRLRAARRLLRPSALRVAAAPCPRCGPTLQVKLDDLEVAVRCTRCGASAVTQSLLWVLLDLAPDLGQLAVYELSSRGPLHDFLSRRAGALTASEYLPDVPPGERRGGVLCQDVERLAFPDASFDLCTSTEVFEHVADDARGFAEIRRVLRPGGRFLFTVPLSPAPHTVERARRGEHGVEYLLPPAYHDDRLTGPGTVLVFRDYGRDVVDRLRAAGFSRAELRAPRRALPWGIAREVVAAWA